MLLLAVESSAGPASVAVLEDGKILGESFVNTKQTHSQTLLPMVQELLRALGKSCAEMDLFAVSNGPGSFTGVRIGVACVKGLAFVNNTPCCGVSTLEAIATNGRAFEGQILCAAMDARRSQVYNALFEVRDGALCRLTEDRAISIEALAKECAPYGDRLLLFGDGAVLCYEAMKGFGARLAPAELRYQRASSVAIAAQERFAQGKQESPAELTPVYLRPPQAERELKLKKEQGELHNEGCHRM